LHYILFRNVDRFGDWVNGIRLIFKKVAPTCSSSSSLHVEQTTSKPLSSIFLAILEQENWIFFLFS